jgi:[CysO sulfur-carrier protein]-S-L-cysteine hydrolase
VGEVLLLREHWDQMRADVIERAPEEACGLVAGKDNRSQEVIKVANILQSPTRFRMDPQQQLEAFLMIEDNNWDLLAIYHSHPGGPEYPSITDIREAAYPEAINLIWYPGRQDWSCRAFIIREGEIKQISITILDHPQSQ